jgi:hypothetical protein
MKYITNLNKRIYKNKNLSLNYFLKILVPVINDEVFGV